MINKIRDFFRNGKSLESEVVETAFFERLEDRELLDSTPIGSKADLINWMGNPTAIASYDATLIPNQEQGQTEITNRTLGIAYKLNKTNGQMYLTGVFENNPNAPWWMNIPPEQFNGFICYETPATPLEPAQPGLNPGERLTDNHNDGAYGVMVFQDIDDDGLYFTIVTSGGVTGVIYDDPSGFRMNNTLWNESVMPVQDSGVKGTIENVVLSCVSGDITLDGNVNCDDIVRLSSYIGELANSRIQGDLINDGVVNAADYIELKRNFGTEDLCVSSSPAPGLYDSGVSSDTVPEPITALPVAAALTGLVLKGTGRKASGKRQKQGENCDVLGNAKALKTPRPPAEPPASPRELRKIKFPITGKLGSALKL